MAGQEEGAHDQVAEQATLQARVDVLAAKLARAERAVGQARTPAAALEAHRRADACLLELEAAEHALQMLKTQNARPIPASHRTKKSAPATEQGHLFDVG